MYFFFQAEDGIRDWSVTGVQTCALPILPSPDGALVLAKTVASNRVRSRSRDRSARPAPIPKTNARHGQTTNLRRTLPECFLDNRATGAIMRGAPVYKRRNVLNPLAGVSCSNVHKKIDSPINPG